MSSKAKKDEKNSKETEVSKLNKSKCENVPHNHYVDRYNLLTQLQTLQYTMDTSCKNC